MDYKQFEETKELVIQVMNENGIGYNKDILSMGSAGYPNDACQDLAEECLGIMAKYCRIGVNGGFTGSMKDALDALSDICAQMSNRKKDRDADKRREACEKKKNDITRTVKLSDEKLATDDSSALKAYLYRNIDRCMQAIPGLIIKNAGQEEVLRVSEKKLELLRTSVEKALDGMSKDAGAKYEEILACLKVWRKAAAASNCTAATNQELDKAIDAAHAWCRLVKPVKNGARYDVSKLVYGRDDIDKIAQCGAIKEKMHNLQSRVSSARQGLAKKYDTTELEDRRKSLEREKAELNARTEEDKERFANGEISQAQLLANYKRTKMRLSKIDMDLSKVNASIENKRLNRDNQESTLASIEDLLREVRGYESEPAAYSVLGDKVPFESVDAIISGWATEQQVQDFISTLRLNLKLAKEMAGVAMGLSTLEFELQHQMEDEMQQLTEEQRRQMEEQYAQYGGKANAQEAKNAEEEALMAELFGAGAKTDVKPVDPIDLPTRRKNDDLR